MKKLIFVAFKKNKIFKTKIDGEEKRCFFSFSSFQVLFIQCFFLKKKSFRIFLVLFWLKIHFVHIQILKFKREERVIEK